MSTSPNAPRSSARSIASGVVPTIGTPASREPFGEAERGLPAELHDDADDAGTAGARPDSFGVYTSRTSSNVSGSKYSRSAVS